MIKNEESLMKKTKKELISIISKQDYEIRAVNADFENVKNQLKTANSVLSKKENKLKLTEDNLKKAAEALNEANTNVYEHQRVIDKLNADVNELTISRNKLTSKIKSNNMFCLFQLIIIVVLAILLIF